MSIKVKTYSGGGVVELQCKIKKNARVLGGGVQRLYNHHKENIL